MRQSILLLAVLALPSCALPQCVFSSDLPQEQIRIGLSPGAEKKALIDSRIELYKSARNGDSDARDAWDELTDIDRNGALACLTWSKEDAQWRERAIRDLARMKISADADASGMKALASVAVAEGDGSLRALARKALAARGDKRAPKLLVTALRFDDALIKANTVETLRELGGPRVFEVIIEHWHEIWGPSSRNHVFFGTQRSYIADYDISGDSYDPVVRSFMTGVVLDTQVLKVEGDAYYVWIREITGERKLPNDPAAWQRWLKKNEPVLAKREEKDKAAAMEFFKE